MNNKKILLYGGGALVFGAVTYFVWSFFKKPVIPIGNTTVALGGDSEEEEEEEENTETTTSGSSTKYDFTPMQFEPLKTTDFNDISNFHLLMRNT
jgi:hypothetical protein